MEQVWMILPNTSFDEALTPACVYADCPRAVAALRDITCDEVEVKQLGERELQVTDADGEVYRIVALEVDSRDPQGAATSGELNGSADSSIGIFAKAAVLIAMAALIYGGRHLLAPRARKHKMIIMDSTGSGSREATADSRSYAVAAQRR